MGTDAPDPKSPDTGRAEAPVSVEAWLRAPVTLTLQRWMLLAAGLAGFVLVVLALD